MDHENLLIEAMNEQRGTNLAFIKNQLYNSSIDAEDVLQEAYLKAWYYRKNFNPAKSEAKNWLFTIVSTTCIDIFKIATIRELRLKGMTGKEIAKKLKIKHPDRFTYRFYRPGQSLP